MEIWKKINGYENYSISSNGNVRNDNTGRILKPGIASHGYLTVALYESRKPKTHLLHRLIAINFINNHFNKKIVNHIDGNKLNNSIENLEWCTMLENIRHAAENGLTASGMRNARCKLSDEDYKKIRELFKSGKTQTSIAKIYKVNQSIISRIINRKRSGARR